MTLRSNIAVVLSSRLIFDQEWMGKREITEKTFTFTPKASFGLVMTIIVFPVWVYGNIKAGMEKKDVQTLGEKREYF